MKKFFIGKTEYNVPTSWMDINLKKFLEIRDHEAKVNEMNLLDYNMEFLSIVTEIDREELDSLTPDEYEGILKELLAVTKDDILPIEHPIFEICGDMYVMDSDFKNMPIAQFIDLDHITSESVWDNAHKLTASFIRRADISNFDRLILNGKKKLGKQIKCSDYKVQKYSYDKLLKTADLFYTELPMPYIYTCIIFFLTFEQILQKNMKDSSQIMEEEK